MLKHPCMAQQALDSWRAIRGRTVSLVVHTARQGNATRLPNKWPSTIVFLFDDDTQLHISGRGANHKVEVMFP